MPPVQNEEEVNETDSDTHSSASYASSLPFDPHQDPEERHRIRKTYRDLTANVTEHHDERPIDFLSENVRVANETFERVKVTGEAALDSAFLGTTINIALKKTKEVFPETNGFDIDRFLLGVAVLLRGNREPSAAADDIPLKWSLVGRQALKKKPGRRVPVMDFMYSPLYKERKQKVIVRRARFDKEKEQEKRPQVLFTEDIEKAENVTFKNIAQVTEAIQIHEQDGVNLFRLVINPHSFGQSVENLFYLSFLIRDGLVELYFDYETGEPKIYPHKVPDYRDYENQVVKKQMIMELDVGVWMRAKETFNITQPMIPTRGNIQVRPNAGRDK